MSLSPDWMRRRARISTPCWNGSWTRRCACCSSPHGSKTCPATSPICSVSPNAGWWPPGRARDILSLPRVRRLFRGTRAAAGCARLPSAVRHAASAGAAASRKPARETASAAPELVRLRNVTVRYGRQRHPAQHQLDRPRRRKLGAARPQRVGQDHPAQPDPGRQPAGLYQ